MVSVVPVKGPEVVSVVRSKTLVISFDRGPHVTETSILFLQNPMNRFTRFLQDYVHLKIGDS